MNGDSAVLGQKREALLYSITAIKHKGRIYINILDIIMTITS